MRHVADGIRAIRPFGRLWLALLVLSVLLTFGAGGGTPASAPWLIIKFGLLTLLLASLVVGLVWDIWAARRSK